MSNILYEYQDVTKDLAEHIKATPALQRYFKADFNTVKASHYCGIVHLDGENHYILPKIADHKDDANLKIFTYMLSYAYDIKVKNEDLANAQNHQSDNILEVFIQLFAKNLLQELQRGIYKEYITEQENLPVLRGKYLINQNLKYNFTKSKIYCEYDEFSMDNALNQFFLYAIKRLMLFAHNKKLLKQCELALDEVAAMQLDINQLNIHFHRLNSRFSESYEFALLLLQRSIPLFEKEKRSFAFLFDMNLIFEKFIGNICGSLDDRTTLQNKKKFLDLTLKPDIIMEDLIIDTKYKKLDTIDEIKQSNKYQMYAYAKCYTKDVMLLYPKYRKDITVDLLLDDIHLSIRTIDLDFDGGYSEYIHVVRKRAEDILCLL